MIHGEARVSQAKPRNQNNDQPSRGQPQEAVHTYRSKPNSNAIHPRKRHSIPTRTYTPSPCPPAPRTCLKLPPPMASRLSPIPEGLSLPDLALTACPPVTTQSSEPRTAAQQQPAQQQPHPPPMQPPPHSQREPQRGDLLAFLPGCPAVMDVCVTHLQLRLFRRRHGRQGRLRKPKMHSSGTNTAAPALLPAALYL